MANGRSAGGALRGLACMVVVAILYFGWGKVLRLFADDVSGDVGLWVYAHDVAPGSRSTRGFGSTRGRAP